MRNFIVYLTFDVDQDFLPQDADYYNRHQPSFDGFKEAMPYILNTLNNRPFSLFMRADYQIKEIFGSYDFLVKRNPELIKRIRMSKGEINWHIHLYEKEKDRWIPIKNKKESATRIYSDFNVVKKGGIINHQIIRIGECVMNNLLMKQMNNLGIKIDSTALPKRFREDEEKHFDWACTSNAMYHPSLNDYRKSGIEHYPLLEVPMTTLEMKTSYDRKPQYRYVNLSFHTDILFQNLQEYIDTHDYLVTMTHPFEILDRGSHGLVGYHPDIFFANFNKLIKLIERRGKNPVFKRMGDIIND